mgnify:CR=1 FL=1
MSKILTKLSFNLLPEIKKIDLSALKEYFFPDLKVKKAIKKI